MPTDPTVTGVLLGSLRSGELVFDAHPSHLEGHPTVRPYLGEALSRIRPEGRERIYEEIDFDRIIGTSNCVATSEDDDIVYAQRKDRVGWTRFVRSRQPEPCSSVVVILARESEGRYILRTAFIGFSTPAEPWDLEARTAESLPFWSTHALVWGYAEIVSGTETRACPWLPDAGAQTAAGTSD